MALEFVTRDSQVVLNSLNLLYLMYKVIYRKGKKNMPPIGGVNNKEQGQCEFHAASHLLILQAGNTPLDWGGK
jgi:hypothetical protein